MPKSKAVPAVNSQAEAEFTRETDVLMSLEELSAFLGVSRWTVYNLISRYESGLPRIKIGREYRFRKSSVDGWIAALERVS